MDEKGVQRGGGRSRTAEKFFIFRTQRPAYRQASGDLGLITIVECVNADDDSIKPRIIFPGKQFHKEWFEVDDDI
jgi:hypothetical protein